MTNLLEKIRSNKKSLFGFMVAMALMMVATSAGAAAPVADAGTVTAVTDGMSGIQLTALAVVAAVAGIAVTLFAAPFAWRYGKKIFQTVAR